MCEFIKMCLFFPKKCARTSEISQINKKYLCMFGSQVSNLFLGRLNKQWALYIGYYQIRRFQNTELACFESIKSKAMQQNAFF